MITLTLVFLTNDINPRVQSRLTCCVCQPGDLNRKEKRAFGSNHRRNEEYYSFPHASVCPSSHIGLSATTLFCGVIRLTMASFCSCEYRTLFFPVIWIDLRVIYLIKYPTTSITLRNSYTEELILIIHPK